MRRTLVLGVLALALTGHVRGTASGCTVFTAADRTTTLFGNNEDSQIPYARLWYLPAEEGKYGRVYLGFDNLGCIHPQGGMNDQGLAFDILAAPAKRAIHPLESEPYLDTYGNLIVKIMEECASVSEALTLFERFHIGDTWSGQYFLADRSGDAAVVEVDAIHRKTDSYLVATNFYLSDVAPDERSCERYQLATAMLDSAATVSVRLFREILAEVHMEGETPTQYSNIFDLGSGTLYLFHHHDYDTVLVIDLEAELDRGRRSIDIASMFPPHADSSMQRARFKEPIVRPLREAYEAGGVGAAIVAYHSLAKDPDCAYDASEWLLKVFGWELADEGSTADAARIFALVASEYPKSADAWEKLGWAYMTDGQRSKAIQSYERSMALDPDNRTAALMLKKLGKE